MSRGLPAGKTIRGYRIDRVLSQEGSFAIVYLATDVDADRVGRRREKVAGRLGRWTSRYGEAAGSTPLDPGPQVALKEYMPFDYAIRRGDMVGPSGGRADVFAWGRERFARESHFLSEHSHPNVVAVYDLFSANNTEYYVMELLKGGSLKDVIRKSGPQSEGQVRQWLLPVLEGLGSVERRNANHLDLSPSNIMFRSRGGAPVLVDFGASRISGTAPIHPSRLVVNDPFAAPEKYSQTSSQLSSQSDIYSLAAIVNFALTGEVPTSSVLRQSGGPAMRDPALALRRRNASPGFLRAVDAAFSLDRTARPSDSRALAQALGAGAARETVTIMPKPETVRAGARVAQIAPMDNRRLTVLVAVAVLLAMLVVALVVLRAAQ